MYEKYNYVLDPHGAVGYYALHKYMYGHNSSPLGVGRGIPFFRNSTSGKENFDTVEEAINKKIAIPESIGYLFNQQKQSVVMNASFNVEFKEWMMYIFSAWRNFLQE